MGLSAAAQGQPRGVRRHGQDDDRKVCQGPGLLSRKCQPYRPADHDPHRHHPRSWACRALDHRHVGTTRISADPWVCCALGHRADVFGLQIARLRHREYPSPLCRPPRPPDPRHGPRPLWGGVDRPVGRRSSIRPRAKKKPGRSTSKVARGRTSWFTRGLRRIIKLLQSCLPLPQLWSVF